MASARQVAANRENGLKGGVKTEEGKAVSRLNARKHSIFVTALTPEDSEEICGYEAELIATLRPVGRIEEMLVEKIALTWLRIQRCARAEAEYHSQIWGDPDKVPQEYCGCDRSQRRVRFAETGVCFNEKAFERMVKLIDLYDTRLTNQFLKLMHEIERMQLLRKGKDAPADETPSASAVQKDVPTLTEEGAPVAETPPAVDELGMDGVAHSRSLSGAVIPLETHSPQPRAAVPYTEEAPALASAPSQVAVGQEASAQTPI